MSTPTRKFLRPSHRKLARVSKEHEHCPETRLVFAMGHVVCSSTWFFLTPMVTYDQVIAKRQFVLYGKMLVISCEMVMEIKLRVFYSSKNSSESKDIVKKLVYVSFD